METQAHLELKHLSTRFLSGLGCRAYAVEVRCPISRYIIDVAGWLDRDIGPGQSSNGDIHRRKQKAKPSTVIIECKQSRSDFLRDDEDREALFQVRDRLEGIRRSIESHRIRVHEPHLKQAGSSLFAELEEWDFTSSRLPSYHKVMRKLRRVNEKLHGHTKFFHMASYRLADRLYLAAPSGLIHKREVPPGWGLLECSEQWLERCSPDALLDSPYELKVGVAAPVLNSPHTRRVRLLRNIAVAACRANNRFNPSY